jgi:hypothetical protein
MHKLPGRQADPARREGENAAATQAGIALKIMRQKVL